MQEKLSSLESGFGRPSCLRSNLEFFGVNQVLSLKTLRLILESTTLVIPAADFNLNAHFRVATCEKYG